MSLSETFNQLVEKTLKEDTLTMSEDPRLQALHQNGIYFHSQPMPEDDEMTEKPIIQEIDQQLPEKNQNLSENDKILNRHRIRYTATRIKYSPTRIISRNLLSNIAYSGINKKDFYNENFILDIYVLLVKNLNPFSLSRKVLDKTKHEMVYMLWRECIPSEFIVHLPRKEFSLS